MAISEDNTKKHHAAPPPLSKMAKREDRLSPLFYWDKVEGMLN